MAIKPTKAEIAQRVSTVYDMLLVGSTRSQIIQYVANKTNWDVSNRTIDNYIQRANAKFEEDAKTHRERELGRALARLNMLYQKTLQIQDYQRCLAIQKELNALLGLYEAQKFEITGIKAYVSISPDDWDDSDDDA